MSIKERFATGRGGVVVKDDRINAHNTFDNFYDILARTNAEVNNKSPGLRRIRTEHVSFAR
jgi:hypothetical protein